MVKNFLDAASCRSLVEIAERQEGDRLKVVDVERSTEKEVVRVFDDRRVTERVDMTEYRDRLDRLVEKALREHVEPAIGAQIEWYEQPQLLRYRAGGFYSPHADAESYIAETRSWRKDLDRDVSLLIYLSDEFEGGCVHFTKFDYRIRPEAGMLIFFPSDSRYQHGAEPVTAGVRYAIVSWSSCRGVEKVMDNPPKHAVIMD